VRAPGPATVGAGGERPAEVLPAVGHVSEAAVVLLVSVVTVAVLLGVGRWQATASVEQGRELLARGHFQAAVRALVPVVARRPRDARAHHLLGLAYVALGARSGAIGQLAIAVRLSPDDGHMHADLGRAYRDAGDLDAARRELEAAVRLSPVDAGPHVALAGVLLDQGQVEPAVQALREAASAHPASAEIRLVLAAALERLGDREAAHREYEEAAHRAAGALVAEMAWQQLRALDARPARIDAAARSAAR
jgi:Flp pilus assembly protein TadD